MLDKETIRTKEAKLNEVTAALKEKFVGIDDVIDSFISAIRTWYLAPELLTRPVIVNLWGLTGSGKTDLVRTFVELIDLSDKFYEDKNSYNYNLAQKLTISGVQPNSPGVVLLDEVQSHRTLDRKGDDAKSGYSLSTWELLSDGTVRCELETLDLVIPLATLSPEIATKWLSLETLKKLALLLKRPLTELRDLTATDLLTELNRVISTKETYKPLKYTKLLIILAGNLDDAYTMATDVAEADRDADVLHEASKKISILNIKEALAKLFLPEQISRFGNTHIIYPALSRHDYEVLIYMQVTKILGRIHQMQGTKVECDRSIFNGIYRNGVFPTQGVRPVISTIANLFESPLTKVALEATLQDVDTIYVSYKGQEFVGEGPNGFKVAVKVDFCLDNLRQDKDQDVTTLTAVHEAGHAVVYGLLTGYSPTQVKINTASTLHEGFVSLHPTTESERSIQAQLAVLLAGRVAEEMVFGYGYRSTGAASDLNRATRQAAAFLRAYGFGKVLSVIRHPNDDKASVSNTGYQPSNEAIEDVLQQAKKVAQRRLTQSQSLFQAVVEHLIKYSQIEPKELVDLFAEHRKTIEVQPPSKTITEGYQAMWQKYSGKK